MATSDGITRNNPSSGDRPGESVADLVAEARELAKRFHGCVDNFGERFLIERMADEIERLRECAKVRDGQIKTACDVADLWHRRFDEAALAAEGRKP